MNRSRPNYLRHAFCSNCSNGFIVKDSYQLYGKRSPLILPCGHSLCETCIRDSLKANNKVSCKTCKNEFTSDCLSSFENLRSEFPLNLFLVGSLFLRSYKSKVGDTMISFKTKTNVSSTIKKASAPQNEPCVECTENNSDVSCKECNTTYCNECFDAVHKRARALQSHQKSYLKKSPHHDEPILKYCSTHKDQKIEFFCKTCGMNTCSYCALCIHTGHEVVHKLTENEKKLDLLKETLEKANKLCRRYQHFKKKAVVAIKQDTGNDGLALAEKEVLAHFDYLHANLQLQEAKMLDEIHKCRTQVEDSRQAVIKDLESVIQEIQDGVKASSDAMKADNLALVNMEDVIENLDRILNKSTYVALKDPVYESDNTDGKDVLFSITNKNLFDVINNHCQIKVPTSAAHFDLLTEDDVPEDFVIEEIPIEVEPEVSVKVTCKKPSSIASSSGGTVNSEKSPEKLKLDADNIGFKNINPVPSKGVISSDSDSTTLKKKASTSSLRHVTTRSYDNDLTPGTMETVRICHFNNPSHFYVHRKGSEAEQRNLANECTRLKIQFKKPPTEVLDGSTYLVQFESDKKWYRGRVLKVENIERILILYVDYGNTEYVSIESLRTIPAKLALTPPMAINCKLYDCHPNKGLEWSTEAIKLMASIITGSILTMHVMRIDELSDKLEVDLTKFHDDSRLSVRDALIFHELACFVVTNSILTDDTRAVKKGSYFSANDFKDGQIFDVAVTHVIDPLNFYVKIVNNNSSFMKNISRQMNDYYKRCDNTFPGMVYSPIIGLPVAVFDYRSNWQRGQVTALPGNRQVEVMFVDTGETKTVPWENLRILQSKFLRMSAQAIRCALSHVIPARKDFTWSAMAIKTFKNLVIKKKLKASVVEYSPDSLKVALYEFNDLVDKCINALFVESGHATSVGITSTLVEYPKYHTMKNPSSSRQNTPRQFPRPSSVRLERHESTSSVLSEAEVQSEASNNEDICVKVEGTGSMRYAVTVKKIFNPGNFYLSFNIQNDQIKRLFDDMNLYYNSEDSKKNQNIELDKGKVCAVFRQDDNQWYRGIIEEVLLDDNVKVLLKDIATTVVVNKSTLAELVEKFLQARDGTFKCRLAGVLAPGGQETWPGIATDVFQEQVEEAEDKLYFSQKGDVNPTDQSIPSELWVKRTVIGGPLEPAREEWYSINRFLIDQGFALPDKSDPPTPAPSVLQGFSDKSSYSSLKLSEANVNVTEWMNKTELLNEVSNAKKVAVPKKPSKVAHQPEAEDSKMPKAWSPPQAFNELNFMGVPTYVDHSCNIYIQDVSSIDTLEVIQRALLSRFQDSKPMAHDLYWFPGQLCIAQYHADKKWYRGRVLEVNSDNTVTVEMVDYGNVEVCKASELRKNICVAHIPIQCHKCSFKQLQPVSEDGKWPISVLDFIHGTIVEKFCRVQLEGSLGEYNVVTLKCPGGLDLSEILLSMNYAKYILDISIEKDDDESASIIIEHELIEDELHGDQDDIDCAATQRSLSPPAPTDPETDLSCLKPEVGLPTDVMCDDSKMSWYDMVLRDEKKIECPKYSAIELPENIDEFFAEVTSILSSTSVMIQIYHKNENSLADMRKKFNYFQDRLQGISKSKPVLSNIAVGDPCICQYSSDQSWYRGLVMDVLPNNTVKVRYVDYGNVELTSKTNVRETTAEIMELPAQALQCSFWGVNITDESKLKECLEALEENIFSSPVLVKIKERTPELLVEVFKEDQSELVYKKLIDRKIYEVTDKVENTDSKPNLEQ